MEKDQFRDHYLPFVKSGFVRTSDLIKNILESVGNYQSLSETQKAFFFLLHKLFEAGEGSLGPVYSFEGGDNKNQIPAKWAGVVSYLKKEGLISDIVFEPTFYDEPQFIKTQTSSPFDRGLSDGKKPWYVGYGRGDSLFFEESIAKAIGEFLERYPLLLYREKDLIRASMEDLDTNGERYLNIRDLAGASGVQKAMDKRFYFDETSEFFWVKGKSFLDNQDCLMPAQLIFWNYNTIHGNWAEPILKETNTSGASGHYTLKKAILGGIYELIQRDGFLIYWLNKASPPQIDPDSIDYALLKELLEECRRLNFEVHFYNTTTEIGVPSCICSVFDHTGVGPKISLGAGCEIDWDKALLRSLTEAFSVYHWIRREATNEKTGSVALFFNKETTKNQMFDEVRKTLIGQEARIVFWANEKMFDEFQFFTEGKSEPLPEVKSRFLKFSSWEQELENVSQKLKSLGKGYEVFCYQAKHKALDDLSYSSVKIVIPALVPLYLNEKFIPLGAGRLRETPEKLGFIAAKEWNRLPHPFP